MTIMIYILSVSVGVPVIHKRGVYLASSHYLKGIDFGGICSHTLGLGVDGLVLLRQRLLVRECSILQGSGVLNSQSKLSHRDVVSIRIYLRIAVNCSWFYDLTCVYDFLEAN